MTITVTVATYFLVSELYVVAREALLVLLVIIASASAILLVQSYYRSTYETHLSLSELYRYKSRQTHPLYYYIIRKDIHIIDATGKAQVDYRMECKNTCPKNLPQIKHEINFDGKIEEFHAHVNGKVFNEKVKRDLYFRQQIMEHEKVDVKQPYNLKVLFNVKSERIAPDQDFDYDYSLLCTKLYPNMDKKDEEYTAIHINHPTDLLVIRIEVPQNLRFIKDGISIQVLDKHDIRDCLEEEKCLKIYPWFVSRDRRRISWEIPNPKIACSYKLYFQAQESRR